MTYYRDWWVGVACWWLFFTINVLTTKMLTWQGDEKNGTFFLQIVCVLAYAVLLFAAWWLISQRYNEDKPLRKLPSADEKEIMAQEAALDEKERLLTRQEKLAYRQNEFNARRDAYVRRLEQENGINV
jgi:hypothetical protein